MAELRKRKTTTPARYDSQSGKEHPINRVWDWCAILLVIGLIGLLGYGAQNMLAVYNPGDNNPYLFRPKPPTLLRTQNRHSHAYCPLFFFCNDLYICHLGGEK